MRLNKALHLAGWPQPATLYHSQELWPFWARYGVCNDLDTRACRDGLAATAASPGLIEPDLRSMLPLLNFTETEFEQAGLLQVNRVRSRLGHTSSGASSVMYVQNEGSSDSAGAVGSSWFPTSVPSEAHALQLRMPDLDPLEGHSPQCTASGAQEHDPSPLQHASDAVRRKRLNSQHQKRFRLRQKVPFLARPGVCKFRVGLQRGFHKAFV